MTDIKDWSNNANIPPAIGNQVPDYMPEGATPIGSVNDWGRENQAAVRRYYESVEWRNFGHTATFATANSFDVAPGGAGALYAVNQRIAIADGSGVVFTTITDVSGDTITVADTLTAPIIGVSVGDNPTNQPVAAEALSGTATINTVGTHTGPVAGDVAGTFTGTVQNGSDIEGDVVGVTQPAADASDKLATTQHVSDKVVAAAGKWLKLEEWDPTGNLYDFVFDSSLYSAIKLIGVGLNSTGNNTLYMRLGYNDGGNIISSNNYYDRGQNTPPGPIVDIGPDNQGIIIAWASALGEFGFELDLPAVGNAGVAGTEGRMFVESRTNTGLRNHSVVRTDANVIDTIQLRWGSSIQFSPVGKVYMYGLVK